MVSRGRQNASVLVRRDRGERKGRLSDLISDAVRAAWTSSTDWGAKPFWIGTGTLKRGVCSSCSTVRSTTPKPSLAQLWATSQTVTRGRMATSRAGSARSSQYSKASASR